MQNSGNDLYAFFKFLQVPIFSKESVYVYRVSLLLMFVEVLMNSWWYRWKARIAGPITSKKGDKTAAMRELHVSLVSFHLPISTS